MKVLLYSINDELFASPLAAVEESLDQPVIHQMPGSDDPDGVLLGVFQHRGRLVSVVDPHAIRDACLASGARC